MTLKRIALVLTAATMAVFLAVAAQAQVGKGIQDLNSLPEAQLAALPNMTPAIAKAFVAARPFASIVDANTFLLGQKLTQEQLTALYEKAFIHLDLNTTTNPEILLVPRISRRMTIEFAEYRPWKTWAQFDREIGKYLSGNPGELDRLRQYLFIPLDLNTATDEQFLTIPNLPQRMLIEFKEYRPWKTKEQFQREISKYVGDKETARLWRYMTITPAQ